MNISVLGFGGQGIVTLGKLLTTGLIDAGFPAVLAVSKGSAQSGGPVRCDIRFSNHIKIYDAVLVEGDIRDWIIMDRRRYAEISHGNVWINSSVSCNQHHHQHIDANYLALQCHTNKGANIVLLGFYLAQCKYLSYRNVEVALSENMFKKIKENNLSLLHKGYLAGCQ